MREVTAALNEGGESLVITVTGSECALEDLQMLVFGLIQQVRRDRAAMAPSAEKKPCGCKEKR